MSIGNQIAEDASIRATYHQLFGKRAPGNWGTRRIGEAVAEKRAELAKAAAAKQHEEDERERKLEERRWRKQQRGPAKEFAEKNAEHYEVSNEANLARGLRWALDIQSQHETQVFRFTEAFREDPHRAMQWADEQFIYAARLYVAVRLISYFDTGASVEDIVDEVTRQVFSSVGSTSRSSSVSAEMTEKQVHLAWIKVLGFVSGRDLF